ncbi:MAG: hypothetical protein H6Q90_1893 [Deltaproteobacteria bacterium]|nr:hypothetical protein [Deltaproteobacteria bacterium]
MRSGGLLGIALVGACAVRGPTVGSTHPAAATAPIGRLAGAPPSLRPGAVVYPDVPAVAPPEAPHHHHPAP